jgi:glycosyltransferase involved in cell wall biosynthesis
MVRIAVLHDQYLSQGVNGVSGEDNLVNLEIELLKDRGHEIIDLRGIETGLRRKLLQGSIHVFGYGTGLPSMRKLPEVIHIHNLNQKTGYSWLARSPAPLVQSLHNLRAFCSVSIGWRSNHECYECLKNPGSILRHSCGGLYGVLGGLRHILFQRNRPQLHYPSRIIASSEMMKNLFSQVFPRARIDTIHNPGIRVADNGTGLSPKGWLFAGRLVPEKGILNLIKYWPETENLDIAGSGLLHDQVRALTKDRPNIRLIGVFPNEDRTIYHRYEGLFFTSTWMEGSPLVVADAIANGLPVIAFGNSAVKEQISLTGGGVLMETELSRDSILDGIATVRARAVELRSWGIHASQKQLSTTRWISQIENSLRLATKNP